MDNIKSYIYNLVSYNYLRKCFSRICETQTNPKNQ
nr:MAG TPA: hypothetical protein [Caudoviricetes sp.]